ncbi:TniQ family protein [Microvirga sp. ACRRW]|uniref:TniQ family protein n=1 Tax=Microvirga sp. ACRRW TaxID=2918205 RepID=UPI001EF6569B|nr:TniQ family protein [Microvirga sp. ACRRW]MCG7394272.1 TniQ family protein [Microvirga sp. ACRRW]
MQTIVPVPITLGADESLASLNSGLASLFRRTARTFCLDMAYSFQAIVDGEAAAIRRLAELSRIDAANLEAAALVRVGERQYRLGGEIFTRTSLSRRTLRGCPHCLLDDMAGGSVPERRPYGRNAWLIAPLRTCPQHNCGLVELSRDETPGLMHDFAFLVKPVLPRLEQLALQAPERQPSALEKALGDRRLGRPISPFLDSLPFYAGARLCEIVGAVAKHGAQVRLETLSEADWYDAGAVGFAIAEPGEGSLRMFLSGLQDAFRYDRNGSGPKAMFGRLHDWLAHETDDTAYDPIRDIIRRHVAETMPIGDGELVLGQAVERKVHSVHSASREYGVHPKRLRKLLHAAGHIRESSAKLSDERTVFDARAAQSFLEQVADSLPLTQARAYLNAPRPHERLLFEAGFIRPMILGGTEDLNHHAFARSDLDAFLARLMARVSVEGEADLVSILQAAKKANCSAMEIVGLILDGRLVRVGRDARTTGYLSVLVDPNEIKPLVRRPDHGGLSLRAVEKALGTDTRVVKALIAAGHLPATRVIHPVKRNEQTVVLPSEVEIFAARFVSLSTIAREHGWAMRTLKPALRQAGIVPCFDPGEVHASFYERDAIRVWTASLHT